MKKTVLLLGIWLTVNIATAALLVEESFDYAATNLVNLNGGAGWSGGWVVESHYDMESNSYTVGTVSLTNYPGMTVMGGHGSFMASGGGTYYPSAQRNFTTGITDDGRAYWLAFQLQAPANHNNVTYTLVGMTNAAFVNFKTAVTGMDFQFLGGAYYSPGDVNAHLFLIKIQMSGDTNAETAWLYYDPNLSASPSTWTALKTNSFSLTSTNGLTGFRSDSSRNGSSLYRVRVDEIRLATTWQEAVGQAPAGIWDGGNASGAWSQGGGGGNWSGVGAPVNGLDMDLVFVTNKNGQVSSNDIADPFEINTLIASNDVTLTGGALRLSGASRVVDVAGSKTATFNNNLVISNSQTFVQGSGNGVIAGTVGEAAPGSGFTKAGSGTWILNGVNTFSGLTRVNGGTLALGASGSINNSTGVQLSTGAVLNVTAAGLSLGSGQTLSGRGTVMGPMTASSGSSVTPGISGLGILTNTLTGGATAVFASGATFAFQLGAPGANDAMAFTGLSAGVTNVTFSGSTLNVSDGGGLAVGTYTLFTFDQNNAYGGTLTLGSVPAGYSANLVYNPGNIQVALSALALSTITVSKLADGAEDGPVNGAFSVSRVSDASTSAAVTVYYTVSGSAATNVDYVALPGSVQINAGATNALIPVTVIQDLNFDEGSKTVILDITPNAGYTVGSPSSATVDIADSAKSLITVVKTADGTEEGPVPGAFSFRRPAGLSTGVAVKVYYSVDLSSTATAGSDYAASLTGNVMMVAGATNVTVPVTVLKDTNFAEGTEWVKVDLTADVAYTVGDPSSTTVNIADAVQPVVTITKGADASEYGAINGAFVISRQDASTGSAVTVLYTIDPSSTATAGSDYAATLTGSVIMAAGVMNLMMPVQVRRDSNYTEGTEWVKLDLVTNAWYSVGNPSTATVNVADDIAPAAGSKSGFAALYTFSNTVYGSTVDTTPVPYESGVIFDSFAMAGTIGINSQPGRFYAENWPANASLNTADYMQVSIAPVARVSLTITNISFDVARMNSGGFGPVKYALRSSRDGYVTNLSTFAINPSNVNLSVTNGDTLLIGGTDSGTNIVWQTGANLLLGDQLTDLTNGVTLRVYGWGNSAGKDGGIDNFSIQGSWKSLGVSATLFMIH